MSTRLPPDETRDEVLGRFIGCAQELWLATGRDALAFDAFLTEHGVALVWSLLLAEVRGPEGPPCLEPTGPGDFCVFEAGHSGPHYGADDVAAPVDLPPNPAREAE